MEQLNLATLPKYMSDEAEAWALLERLRWTDGVPVCPHCGTADPKHYFLTSRSGQRLTRTGNPTYRRLWKCRDKDCRRQFSVLVGTVFESSKMPVSKWLLALYLVSAGKNGCSALELQRHLGVAYQTAWFCLHRLREAMTRDPLAGLLSGTVTVDETFVGGAPKNKHQQGRAKRARSWGPTGADPKTPVLALVTDDEARGRVVTDVTGNTLYAAIKENVDLPNTDLRTDGHKGYIAVGQEARSHETVDHTANEYVRWTVDGAVITSNLAESFFAQFKRSLDGTYHNVSKQHLGRYVDEFTFRWTTRKVNDHQRTLALLPGARGKRLTYKPAL